MASPSGGVGNSNSNVRTEPFDHLIQPLKQVPKGASYYVRLYEALKKISTQVNNLYNTVVPPATSTNPTPPATPTVVQDKATFGITQTPVVQNGLTNDYICRKNGNFIDIVGKCLSAPSGGATIFNIDKSTDQGTHWTPIMATGLNFTGLNIVSNGIFTQPSIAIGDLLRINCTAVGSTPGSGFEIVLRWA